MSVLQAFVGSFTPPIAVTGVTLDKSSAALLPGGTVDFTVTIQPDNATNKRYTVTSANTDLVTVARKSGDTWTATAASGDIAGTTTITVTSVADTSKTATLAINVGNLTPLTVTVTPTDPTHATITVTPAVASGQVRWYKVTNADAKPTVGYDDVLNTSDWTALSDTAIEAREDQIITVVDVTSDDHKARGKGEATVPTPPIGSLTVTATARVGGQTLAITPATESGNMLRYKITAANNKPTVTYGMQCPKADGWEDLPSNKQITGTDGQVVTVVEMTTQGALARKTGTATLPAPLTGPTEDEKQAWHDARMKEVQAGTYKGKVPSADFEPLTGWKPFADYGSSPAEIISNAAKANDFQALFPGDYLNATVSGTSFKFTIASLDHLLGSQNTAHHAYMVADKLWKNTVFSSSNNTYQNSTIWSENNNFYNAMPSDLKPYVLNIKRPWWNYSGSYSTLTCRVFQPTEIEAFGSKQYSAETVVNQGATGSQVPNHHLQYVFKDNNARIRKLNNSTQWYWLASAYSGIADSVPVVYTDGAAAIGNYTDSGGLLPCFCIG